MLSVLQNPKGCIYIYSILLTIRMGRDHSHFPRFIQLHDSPKRVVKKKKTMLLVSPNFVPFIPKSFWSPRFSWVGPDQLIPFFSSFSECLSAHVLHGKASMG